MNKQRDNNGLHQTGREGVAFAFRRRPVVEARPAGEAGCWTERGTERMRIRGCKPRGSSKRLVAARNETAQHEPRSRRGLSAWSLLSGSLLDHFPGMVGEASTISSQSAFLSLDRFVETADRLSPVGTPRP